MSTINIQIKNIKQIRAAFNAAPGLMTRELNTAIRKVTLNIQGKSMRNTPVLTGRLRASSYSTFGNLRGEVGTNTNYDIFVHDGTRYMKPRPYLKTAVEDSEHDTDRFFTEAVDNTLNKIGRMT